MHKRDKEIHHTQCCCLPVENDYNIRCMKRYFSVFDMKKGRTVHIYVCNELIRCLMNESIHEKTDGGYYKGAYYDVVMDIISHYVYVPQIDSDFIFGRGNKINDLGTQRIYITICNRPFIFVTILFKDLLALYLKHENLQIRGELLRTLRLYLDHMYYKKYKSRYKEIQRLLRQIDKNFASKSNDLMNELFFKIYEIQIKNHETSKQ